MDKKLDERNALVAVERKVRDMRLLYTSADKILSKGHELMDIIKKKRMVIVYLTETKLVRDDTLKIIDCNVWRKNRGRGGLIAA